MFSLYIFALVKYIQFGYKGCLSAQTFKWMHPTLTKIVLTSQWEKNINKLFSWFQMSTVSFPSLLNDWFQFTKTTHSSLMNNAVYLPSSQSIVYEHEGDIFKVKFDDNSHKKILVKKSHIESQNQVAHLRGSKDENVFIISKGNGIKFVKIEENNFSKTQQLGFICAHCLARFSSSKKLTTEHRNMHFGPAQCSTCQVCTGLKSF